MNLIKIILIISTLSMIFSKSVNSLDRYDEIIAQEFTLVDNQGNILMKLSKIDLERLDLKIINNRKYLQKVDEAQNQLSNMYLEKIDSVDNNFRLVNNKIEQNYMSLRKQINSLKEELNSLQNEYSAYKKSVNSPNDIIISKIIDIESEMKKVNDRVNAILEFDVMQKEIKKKKKAYYLP